MSANGTAPAAPTAKPAERELRAKRERLAERFTAMQLDLGGVLYEMAIRDHVKLDVLTSKAAELQRVDAELRHVEQVLDGAPAGPGTPAGPGAPDGPSAPQAPNRPPTP